MEGSYKLEDVELAWERMKEAKVMLHLVEDSFGIQDRIIDPPWTEGTRVKQDREPAMEGESNPETDLSKTIRSLRTQNVDWSSLRPHSSLIQISPESTRTLPCSRVLSEKTNLPQNTPERSRIQELTDDIICILHKHQPMSCSDGSTEGRGTQSPAGSAASPLFNAQRRQLLKAGSPTGRTLQNLKERIHQQRQQHQAVEGSTTEVYQQGAITRKVRKVTFAPPPPVYRGFTIVAERTESPGEDRASLQPGSKGTTCRRDQTQGTGHSKSPRLKKTTSPSSSPSRDMSRQTRGRSPGVSAWRDGQRLVRMLLGPAPRPKRGESATQGSGESQFSEEKNDIKHLAKKRLFPSNGNPGLYKRSPSLSKRSPSPSQRTTALSKRSPSPSQRTTALSKRSPSPSQRTTTLSKRSPSPSQISTVLSKKSTSPSHRPSQKSPMRSAGSPVPSQSPTHNKRHQAPQRESSSPPTGRTARWDGKENTGPQEPQRPPKARSYSAEEVRAFMGRRAKERTRRALDERREAHREEERRRGLLEEVLRKQRDALHRAQGSRSPGAHSRKRQGQRDTNTKKERPAAGRQSDGDTQDWLQRSRDRVGRAQEQGRGAPVELVSVEGTQREVCSSSPLRLADLAPTGRLAGGAGTAPLSRAERVEAIRQAAAALGARVETETARLGASARLSVGAGARQQAVPGCSKTGQSGTSALPRDQDSTSASEELPWSEDPEQPGARRTQPDSTGTTRGVCEERKQKAGTAKTGAQNGSLPPGRLVRGGAEKRVEKERQQETSRSGQQSTSPGMGQSRTQPSFKGRAQTDPEALSDDSGGPGAGEASPEAAVSSSSEADTESTSKWSEVSQFFGRGEMLNRLSLELSQQTLRDEELRARHHSALFRLREEALSEKTQAELAWLEHQKMCLREGEEDTLAEIARRQEDVLHTLQQEKTEIRHLQNVYRAARQQRKLLLRHQREILGIQRSAALIKSKLLGDSALSQENPESAEQQLQGGLENNTALYQLQGDLSKHSAVHLSQGNLKKHCALHQFQDDVKKDGAVRQSHRDLSKYSALQLSPRELHENTALLHLQGDLNKYCEVQQEDTKLHQLQGGPEEYTTLNQLKGDHEEGTTLHHLKGGPQEGTTLHHLKDGPQEDTVEDTTLYDLQGEEPAGTTQQKLQEGPQKDTTLHELPGSPLEDTALHNIQGGSQEDTTLHQLHSDGQKHSTGDHGNTTWEQIPDQSSSSERPGSSPGPEPRERQRRVAEPSQNTSSELGDRFVMKTERDASPTEGSWSWENRKSDPEILGLETDVLCSDPEDNEQDIQNLETKRSKLDSLHSDQENSDTDNQEWDDKEWGSEDHEAGKIEEGSTHVVEDRTQTDGQVIDGKACNLESEKEEHSQKNIDSYESSEEESSCSRFNLKLHLSSNSNDLSLKSQKSLGSYPSLQEFQRASAVRINISETSVSSLEIEEEIPFDTESSKGEVLETGSPQGLDSPDLKSKRVSNDASPIKEECPEEVNQQQITKIPKDSMRHSSQNDYLTQSDLLVDHSPFKSKQYMLPRVPGIEGDQFHQSYTVVEEIKKDHQDIGEPILPRVEFPKDTSSAEKTTEGKPNKGGLFLDLEPRSPDSSLKISGSNSDDFSESEAPEPQEEFFRSSQELVSSREEQLILEGIECQGKGTSDLENNLKPLVQNKASRETESQVTKNSTGQPCPETSSSLPPKIKRHVKLSSSGRVLEKAQAPKDSPLFCSAMRDGVSINSRRPLSDENLSEIFSPLDEVLSYGSAELPPPIARETGCEACEDLLLPPPPPAGEVITWTSEDASFQSEDFPPVPEELGEFGKERPQYPVDDDPSIKSEDLPSLSEDLAPPVEECYTEELNSSPQEKQFLDPMDKSMVAVNHKCEKQTLEVVANGSQFQPSQEDVEHQEQSSQHFKKGTPFVTLTNADESDSDSLSDPLSSFHIGDRVLVCHTKPGVLKFKGLTSFATGHWAGVALDSPSGHHNGTYRGIRYFECPKNCGVLVRAEDISHLLGGHETDTDFKANEDPFSDGDSPEKFRSLRDNIGDSGLAEGRGEGGEKRSGESGGKEPSGEKGGKQSLAPKVCETGSYSPTFEEINNNIQNTAVFIEEEWNLAQSIPSSTASEFSTGETDLQQIINEARAESKQNEEDISLELDSSVTTNTNKKLGSELPADRMIQELPETNQRKSLSISGAPLIGERHTHKEEMGDSGTLGSPVLDCLVHSVAGELLSEVVREFQGIRKRKQQQQEAVRTRGSLTNTPKSPEPGVPESLTIEKCQQEPCSPSTLCYLDQWQCTTSTAPPLEDKRLHDPAHVRTLVGSAVERLWSKVPGQKVGECDVQGKREGDDFMADEESRKAYKQVIFDLTSDIFHDAFQEDLNTSTSPWRGKGVSTLSALLCSRPTLKEVKSVMQAEVLRLLNLDRSDLEMRRILQKMSKFGKAQRDRVDYILIQELHEEESQWVDYSADKLSVKMRLTEEIFDALLQDTIQVLKHIDGAPPTANLCALQPAFNTG